MPREPKIFVNQKIVANRSIAGSLSFSLRSIILATLSSLDGTKIDVLRAGEGEKQEYSRQACHAELAQDLHFQSQQF